MLGQTLMMTTRMPQPWEGEQTLESLPLHYNQTHFHTLLRHTDPVCRVHTSLPTREPDHHTLLEMYHGSTLPTTPKLITMLHFELL